MKKALILLIAVVVVAAGLTCLPDVHVARGNLWAQVFDKEPVEKLLVLFKDGRYFLFTNYDPNGVEFPESWLFCDQGKKPGEIVLVIHNHPNLGRFSAKDIALYRRLRREGFSGEFLLYLPTGTVLEHAETK